jgi:hypothetical protein
MCCWPVCQCLVFEWVEPFVILLGCCRFEAEETVVSICAKKKPDVHFLSKCFTRRAKLQYLVLQCRNRYTYLTESLFKCNGYVLPLVDTHLMHMAFCKLVGRWSRVLEKNSWVSKLAINFNITKRKIMFLKKRTFHQLVKKKFQKS